MKPTLAAAINSTILVQGNYILLVPGEISLHHSSASYDSAYIHSRVKSFPSGTMITYQSPVKALMALSFGAARIMNLFYSNFKNKNFSAIGGL